MKILIILFLLGLSLLDGFLNAPLSFPVFPLLRNSPISLKNSLLAPSFFHKDKLRKQNLLLRLSKHYAKKFNFDFDEYDEEEDGEKEVEIEEVHEVKYKDDWINENEKQGEEEEEESPTMFMTPFQDERQRNNQRNNDNDDSNEDDGEVEMTPSKQFELKSILSEQDNMSNEEQIEGWLRGDENDPLPEDILSEDEFYIENPTFPRSPSDQALIEATFTRRHPYTPELQSKFKHIFDLLDYPPLQREELEGNMSTNARFRLKFYRKYPRLLSEKHDRIDQQLDLIANNSESMKKHYFECQTNSSYKIQFEKDIRFMDEQRAREDKQQEENDNKINEWMYAYRESLVNKTLLMEVQEKVQTNATLNQKYSQNLRSTMKYTAAKQLEFNRFREYFREIEENHNEGVQQFLENKMRLDPSFQLVVNKMWKFYLENPDSPHGSADIVMFDAFKPIGHTVMIPPGVLINRVPPTVLDEIGNYAFNKISYKLQVIKKMPITYNTEPTADGKHYIWVEPFDDVVTGRRDFNKVMLVVPEQNFEVEYIEDDETFEVSGSLPDDNPDYDPTSSQYFACLTIPFNVRVQHIDPQRLLGLGNITGVVISEDLAVSRITPDKDFAFNEVCLALPPGIQTHVLEGSFPKGQLFITPVKNPATNRVMKYELTQEIPILRMLPEDIVHSPNGVLCVPPMCAVTTKAHEFLDDDTQKFLLSTLPDGIREVKTEEWKIYERDKERMSEESEKSPEEEDLFYRNTPKELDLYALKKKGPEYEKLKNYLSGNAADLEGSGTFNPSINNFLRNYKLPTSYQELDALGFNETEWPVYSVTYEMDRSEMYDLNEMDRLAKQHSALCKRFPRLVHYEGVHMEKDVKTSFLKIRATTVLRHMFVGYQATEYQAVENDIENFLLSCPYRNSEKVWITRIEAYHTINGRRGRMPARFQKFCPDHVESPLTEKEEIYQYLQRVHNIDDPEGLNLPIDDFPNDDPRSKIHPPAITQEDFDKMMQNAPKVLDERTMIRILREIERGNGEQVRNEYRKRLMADD